MEEEGGNKKKAKANLSKEDDDYEEFLDDVEKDKDMRKNMVLFRDEDNIAKLTEKELILKEKHRVRTKGRKMIKVKKTETDEPKEQ
jgi:nonsense-mediated mRNA decay protein 3